MRFITLLLLSFLCTAAKGQDFTVKSFDLNTMDMSASVYKRVDKNGETCALVKVVLPKKDVMFEGSIVGPVENKGAEYWVYLTPGTKMFKIKHQSFEPLMVNTADYGINSLQGNRTYILWLITPVDTTGGTEIPEDIDTMDVMSVFNNLIEEGKYNECYNMARMLPNNEIALYFLGLIYSQGYGRDVDVDAAMKAFKKSSDMEYPPSDFMLVKLYIDYGIKDFNEASTYIARAAVEANPWAAYILGRMYFYGIGVEQNDEKSLYWLEEADKNNFEGEDFLYLDYILFRKNDKKPIIRKIKN